MFFVKPGKATPIKKTIYLLASIILGVLLSIIAHSLVEIFCLSWAMSHGQTPVFYGNCIFPSWLQVLILLAGAMGGLYLGRWWWGKVYVERVWRKKRAKR